ncbi:MAG TPA: response regulator [Ardenticatenaceae bacterium]|nr:response regulator [Ardenticatenaceae bacterium]
MTKTVLVVEDDADVRGALAALMEFEGYDVVTAGDGIEALEQFGRQVPSLILLDMTMPRMDGITFAQELERRELHRAAPIIFLSCDYHDPKKLQHVTYSGFVAKPFTITALLDEVTRVVAV